MPFLLGRLPSRWLITAVVLVVAAVIVGVAVREAVTPEATGTVEAVWTLPAGSALPSDAECARRVERNAWEPRPDNADANQTIPPGPVISRSWAGPSTAPLQARVTGAFTGTTDEILQWASCKWGLATDVVRAQAVQESRWRQSTRGDGGVSLGLMQIKSTYWHGTAPWSARSTAYNVDWSLGLWRACFEGLVHGAQARGDLWGCVGAHYSGFWLDPLARKYIRWVQEYLAAREWLEWPSPAGGQPPTPGR
jgi:hypothetical protein